MGDPQTLVDFVSWGVKEFPAQHYALMLWDHGSSWAGIAFDDTDGEKGISLPELDAALRTSSNPDRRSSKLDLIGFDACLMASSTCCRRSRRMARSRWHRPSWSRTRAGPGMSG